MLRNSPPNEFDVFKICPFHSILQSLEPFPMPPKVVVDVDSGGTHLAAVSWILTCLVAFSQDLGVLR